MDTLAVIESTPERLAEVVETATLPGGDTGEKQEMYVRVADDCVETPASAQDASLSSYCTLAADGFDRLAVTGPTAVDAMFEIEPLLGWLDWVDGDEVTVRFHGEVGAASRLSLTAGEDEVDVGCLDDPAVLDNVETVLPDRFDGDQFLDGSGQPMPTTVETTAAQLRRLVDAVDLAAADGYPLVVRDGRLVVDVDGDAATVSAPLSATVDGPAVTNRYGSAFAAVGRELDGVVELQTGPGEPVAVVQRGDGYTLRFVVTGR